jgi:AraC-like DNA-binding protein
VKRGDDISVRLPGLYLIHHNKPAIRVRRYVRPEHVVFIPLQGEIHLEAAAETHVCGPGRMLYLPPALEHSLVANERLGERLIAMIDAPTWRNAGGGAHDVAVIPASQLVKELVFHLLLHPAVARPQALGAALVVTLSEGLAAAADAGPMESAHFEGKARDARVRKALAVLRESLDAAVSMQAVATRAGVSVRNMNRLFLEDLGLTPRQVLIQMRIGRARELLQEGAPVTQVALDCGYRSLSSFITVFRQLTGQVPSEFRRLGRK